MSEEITLAALAKAARNDDAQLDIQKAAETATLTFTAEERQKIDEIKSELDLRESVTAVEFGIGCQRRLAEFADTVLDNSTKDDTDVAGQLQALLGEIKSLDAGSAFKDTFWSRLPVIGSRARRMKKLKKNGMLTIALHGLKMKRESTIIGMVENSLLKGQKSFFTKSTKLKVVTL